MVIFEVEIDSPMDQARKAELFRSLHHGRMLVLPNAWDVPSARVFEDSGFPALATSSAGLFASLGFQDGEEIGVDALASAVGRISRVLSVPLSADMVGGFGKDSREVASSVSKVIEAGAVGLNIEDFEHSTRRLVPLEDQVAKLKELVRLKDVLGVPFVINGRTDAFRYAEGDEGARLAEAIRRAKAYRDAGADCVYPMGLVNPAPIASFVEALRFPTNVMVRKGLPSIADLRRLGVARVSFGPSASYAAMGLLKRAAREVLEKGTYNALTEGAISFDELNSLAVPREPKV